MSGYIPMQAFCQYLSDDEEQAETASLILQATLGARSPRISGLSHRMPGNPDANCKRIQRFLATAEPKTPFSDYSGRRLDMS